MAAQTAEPKKWRSWLHSPYSRSRQLSGSSQFSSTTSVGTAAGKSSSSSSLSSLGYPRSGFYAAAAAAPEEGKVASFTSSWLMVRKAGLMGFGQWRRRFVKIEGESLLLYADDGPGAEFKGVVPIRGITVSAAKTSSKSVRGALYGFTTTDANGATIAWAAFSVDERRRWTRALEARGALLDKDLARALQRTPRSSSSSSSSSFGGAADDPALSSSDHHRHRRHSSAAAAALSSSSDHHHHHHHPSAAAAASSSSDRGALPSASTAPTVRGGPVTPLDCTRHDLEHDDQDHHHQEPRPRRDARRARADHAAAAAATRQRRDDDDSSERLGMPPSSSLSSDKRRRLPDYSSMPLSSVFGERPPAAAWDARPPRRSSPSADVEAWPSADDGAPLPTVPALHFAESGTSDGVEIDVGSRPRTKSRSDDDLEDDRQRRRRDDDDDDDDDFGGTSSATSPATTAGSKGEPKTATSTKTVRFDEERDGRTVRRVRPPPLQPPWTPGGSSSDRERETPGSSEQCSPPSTAGSRGIGSPETTISRGGSSSGGRRDDDVDDDEEPDSRGVSRRRRPPAAEGTAHQSQQRSSDSSRGQQAGKRVVAGWLTKDVHLGSGTFGNVYRGTYFNQLVAIKELIVQDLSSESIAEFEREADLHYYLRHANIILLMCYNVDFANGPTCMVMELAECSLFDVLHRGAVLPDVRRTRGEAPPHGIHPGDVTNPQTPPDHYRYVSTSPKVQHRRIDGDADRDNNPGGGGGEHRGGGVLMDHHRHHNDASSLHPKQLDGDGLTLERKLEMLEDVASGLVFLHTLDIMHLDLKSLNLLLDANGVVKLADFGLSVVKNEIEGSEGKPIGSIPYMAPELMVDDPVPDKMCDVYSFYVVIWEVICRQQPHEDRSPAWIMKFVSKRKKVLEIPRHVGCPERLEALMLRCAEFDPRKRPSMEACQRAITDVRLDPVAPSLTHVELPANALFTCEVIDSELPVERAPRAKLDDDLDRHTQMQSLVKARGSLLMPTASSSSAYAASGSTAPVDAESPPRMADGKAGEFPSGGGEVALAGGGSSSTSSSVAPRSPMRKGTRFYVEAHVVAANARDDGEDQVYLKLVKEEAYVAAFGPNGVPLVQLVDSSIGAERLAFEARNKGLGAVVESLLFTLATRYAEAVLRLLACIFELLASSELRAKGGSPPFSGDVGADDDDDLLPRVAMSDAMRVKACRRVVASLVTFADDAHVQLAGVSAVVNLALDATGRTALAKFGACKAVVDALRRHGFDSDRAYEVRRVSVEAILNLLSDDGNAIALREAGATKALLRVVEDLGLNNPENPDNNTNNGLGPVLGGGHTSHSSRGHGGGLDDDDDKSDDDDDLSDDSDDNGGTGGLVAAAFRDHRLAPPEPPSQCQGNDNRQADDDERSNNTPATADSSSDDKTPPGPPSLSQALLRMTSNSSSVKMPAGMSTSFTLTFGDDDDDDSDDGPQGAWRGRRIAARAWTSLARLVSAELRKSRSRSDHASAADADLAALIREHDGARNVVECALETARVLRRRNRAQLQRKFDGDGDDDDAESPFGGGGAFDEDCGRGTATLLAACCHAIQAFATLGSGGNSAATPQSSDAEQPQQPLPPQAAEPSSPQQAEPSAAQAAALSPSASPKTNVGPRVRRSSAPAAVEGDAAKRQQELSSSEERRLLRRGSSSIVDAYRPPIADELLDAGAAEAISAALRCACDDLKVAKRCHSPLGVVEADDLARRACAGTMALAAASTRAREALGRAGICEATIAVIRRMCGPNDPDLPREELGRLRYYGIGAVSNLAFRAPLNKERLENGGALPAIASCAEAGADDLELQRLCCRAFCTLGTVDTADDSTGTNDSDHLARDDDDSDDSDDDDDDDDHLDDDHLDGDHLDDDHLDDDDGGLGRRGKKKHSASRRVRGGSKWSGRKREKRCLRSRHLAVITRSMLSFEDPTLQHLACAAIINLAAEPKHRRALGGVYACEAVTTALKANPMDARVQEYGFRAAVYLARDEPANRERFYAHGVRRLASAAAKLFAANPQVLSWAQRLQREL